MRDLWNLFRGGIPRLERVGFGFEKAGVRLDGEPIPWVPNVPS